MSCSVFHMGPGAMIAPAVSELIEKLIRIIQNDNDVQLTAYQMQKDAATTISDTTIAGFNEDATSMLTQGSGQIAAGVLQGAAMGVGLGLTKGPRKLLKMGENARTNLMNLQMEEELLPPSASTSGTASQLSKNYRDLCRGGDPALKVLHQDPAKLDIGQLRAHITSDPDSVNLDRLYDRNESDIKNAQMQQDRIMQMGQSVSTMCQSLATGIGSSSAATHKALQGKEEAKKAIFQLLMEISKDAPNTRSKNVDNNTQGIAALLSMEQAVFSNNSYHA